MNSANKSASTKPGLVIRSLSPAGFLFAAGLRPLDRVITIDGYDIADDLDFYYHAARDFFEIDIERGGREETVEVERAPGVSLDIDFYEKPVGRCVNRCIFCFIDQMPKGLRDPLYVKDEDIRHSFLNGNYVTLASASRKDLARVATIGLSPLFISVHATDRDVRKVMLGNRNIPDIRQQLAYLTGNGIAFHTQIVLCPGYNDGAVLERTVNYLFGYGESLLSIAVVPVGLTRFRKKPLMPVYKSCAVDVCGKMGAISERMKARDGVRKLFLADEFFIRAELPIPPASYYEDYPQIENGVGLVRQLLQESARIKRKLRGASENGAKRGKGASPLVKSGVRRNNYAFSEQSRGVSKKKNTLVVTGCSAYPYIRKALDDIMPLVNCQYDAVAVENEYMGDTVTVAGLLTAKDVIRKIKGASVNTSYNEVILPAAMFNHEGRTLDGYSLSRVEKEAGVTVRAAGTIEEMVGTRNLFIPAGANDE